MARMERRPTTVVGPIATFALFHRVGRQGNSGPVFLWQVTFIQWVEGLNAAEPDTLLEDASDQFAPSFKCSPQTGTGSDEWCTFEHRAQKIVGGRARDDPHFRLCPRLNDLVAMILPYVKVSQ